MASSTVHYIKDTYFQKINHTERVYLAMQAEHSTLRFGKSDLEWNEMWSFYDQLKEVTVYKKQEHLLLPDHLLINLKKPCHGCFFKLSGDYFEKWTNLGKKMVDSPRKSKIDDNKTV